MLFRTREGGVPKWFWFLVALPVGFMLMWIIRRRSEDRHLLMEWQRQEDAFRERQMGEAYQSTSALTGRGSGDQAATRPVESASSPAGRTSEAAAPEETTAEDHLSQMGAKAGSTTRQGFGADVIGASAYTDTRPADTSPVSDETLAGDLEEEDSAVEEQGSVAVTGGPMTADAPTAEATVDTTQFDEASDILQEGSMQATEADNLALIEGIGPAISNLLRSQGIHTFQQLASTPVERLDEILRQADLRRIADPGTWPEQAQYAANGDMEGLQRFQDTLKAGRRQS